MENNFYLADILSQDEKLRNALEYYKSPEVCRKLNALKERQIQKVIFSGMGSSHFCAIGADLLLKQHGIESQVISTGELIYYESENINEKTVLCLISQSGESAETRHLISQLKDDIFVIAVTNNMESTLGKRGNISFALHVSDEISVTTRTYSSSLILVQLIAAAICGDSIDEVFKEYEKAVFGISNYLECGMVEASRMKNFCGKMNSISLIGRGNGMSSVCAGALFFREVAKFPALDFDSAEFRHGPMEMVQEGFYGIVFAQSGRTQNLSIQMACDIAEKGGRVILITDTEGGKILPENCNILPIILPKVEEYASQILQIVPVQLMANAVAEDHGIQPGVFRWGSKIMGIE